MGFPSEIIYQNKIICSNTEDIPKYIFFWLMLAKVLFNLRSVAWHEMLCISVTVIML